MKNIYYIIIRSRTRDDQMTEGCGINYRFHSDRYVSAHDIIITRAMTTFSIARREINRPETDAVKIFGP